MKQKTCVRAPGFEDGKAVGVTYSSQTETPIITNSNLIGWGNFPNTVGFQAAKKKKIKPQYLSEILLLIPHSGFYEY